MTSLRILLIVSTIIMYTVSIYVIGAYGINWPAIYFDDLLALDWRSQFNTDFLIHLFLLAIWIMWREGFTYKGCLFAFLSIFMGGMFGFPYILYATYKAKGDPKIVMLGIHANK